MSDVDEQGTQSRILVVTKDLSRPTEAGLGSQQAIPDLRETVAALDKGTTSVRGEQGPAGCCLAVCCDNVQRLAVACLAYRDTVRGVHAITDSREAAAALDRGERGGAPGPITGVCE